MTSEFSNNKYKYYNMMSVEICTPLSGRDKKDSQFLNISPHFDGGLVQ